MNYLLIVLRLIHIFGGIFWVGGVLLLTLFITPAVAASAENGQKFMQHLMGQTRLSSALASAGGASILAGLILYWLDSDGLSSPWMKSGPGIGFAIGAIFGLIGFAAGIMMARSNKALAAVGRQIQGKPTPQQAAEIATIRSQLAMLTPINTAGLILAAVLMAVSRYLSF